MRREASNSSRCKDFFKFCTLKEITPNPRPKDDAPRPGLAIGGWNKIPNHVSFDTNIIADEDTFHSHVIHL
jgi:hypothetical protein